MNKIMAMGVVISVLFLLGCSSKNSVEEFKRLCTQNGHGFMVMPESRNFVAVSKQPCAGCMVGGNHYCSMEEYLDAIGK
ncbi:MAG: hypothetical protein AABX37_01460 [Nanoarchaeota archaeon]